jgi:predicted secreted protein
MSITGSIVVFIILWWLILFMILPRNINSQQEKGGIIEGTDPGAPSNPNIFKKLVLTTAIASLLFAIIFVLTYFNILNIREILSK